MTHGSWDMLVVGIDYAGLADLTMLLEYAFIYGACLWSMLTSLGAGIMDSGMGFSSRGHSTGSQYGGVYYLLTTRLTG